VREERARERETESKSESGQWSERQRDEQPLRRNVKRFRGGLVFKAHRLVYHSTLGSRVIKKKKKTKKTEWRTCEGDTSEEDPLGPSLISRRHETDKSLSGPN